jgi:hypothetical protein
MTHGEGVEQNWAFSNGAAASTRLMGPGSQQTTLEDVFGFHNYDRVLAMRAFHRLLTECHDTDVIVDRVLPKRLVISIKEGTKHRAAFEAFSKGLEEARPDEVKRWKEEVLRWEMNPHPESSQSKSPFESVQQGTSVRLGCRVLGADLCLEVTLLRDIQLEIAKEEFMCTEDGVEVEREHSPGGFLTMGLEVEEAQ